MRRQPWRIGLAVVVFGAASLIPVGCTQTGDIGRECFLVKSDGDGGTARITEGELQPNRDILSFGSLECEDFVCVRHRFAQGEADPAAFATGTCSTKCVPNDPAGCTALDPSVDLTDGEFTCRALLLDEETLSALCLQSPQLCQDLGVGENPTPYFCAQGAERPDAGT